MLYFNQQLLILTNSFNIFILGVCYTCATDIFQKTGECYLCRFAIKQILELDLSEKVGDLVKVKASARLVTCDDSDTSKFEE